VATFVRSQEIEHDLGPAGRFALRVTSPDVELRATQTTIARVRVQFEVRAESDADADEVFERIRFHVRQGEGVLEVTEPKHGSSGIGSLVRILSGGSTKIEASVTAEVPASADITFDGVSADVTANGFTGAQEFRTVSGDLVLHPVGGDLRIRGVSSDISLRADAPMRLDMNTVSGDVSAFAPRIDELRMVTVSGDVELEGLLAPGPQHSVETVSGDLLLATSGGLALEVRGLSTDVSVSLPHRSEGSRDRRRFVVGDGDASLLFSSMSGDVVVSGPRRGSGIVPPVPPSPPSPVTPPTPPTPPSPPRRRLSEAEQLKVLQALERGEIDVDEATKRLAGEDSDA
jgi:putative adhesin